MNKGIDRETLDELGGDLFGCLCTAQILTNGLRGLGGLVGGLVETATHSEVTPESLTVIMEKLYEYSEMAEEASETLLGLKKSTA